MVTGLASPVGGAKIGGTSPVTFTSAAPQTQVDADLIVEWDFDNDGDFDEPEEDLDGYVLALETLSGRDYPSSLTGEAGPGQLRLTLLNDGGRFSHFNTSSPLNTAPFSLRTGRKIRVRVAGSVPDDPLLLARDRFRRVGALGAAETGQVWTPRVGQFFALDGAAQAAEVFGTRLFETINVGQVDYYVQATLRQLPPSNARIVGLVVRWTDANNYTIVRYNMLETAPVVLIQQRVAGVGNTLATYPVRLWEGATIGAGVVGATVTAYVGGVPVASATTGTVTGNHCGLHAEYSDFTGRAPELADFHVWDKVPGEVDGILWTGHVLDVTPRAAVGDIAVAEVSAEGILSDAARAEIASPRLPLVGAPTGLVVGDVLSRAGLLHPPGPIQAGTITTGPIGVDDADALALARDLEEVERGFLHETNEGHVGYHDRATRLLAAPAATFTDTPGVGGQFPYSAIVPLDHKGQVINEVTAGVAADATSDITVTTQSGVTSVAITLPAATFPGDILVVFIANSMNDGSEWAVPPWWVSHRDVGADYGMRIYSHACDGAEGGTVVTFYANAGLSAGLWVAQIYHIRNWFDLYDGGIAVGEVVRGGSPAALGHNWGREPALFIVARAGLGAVAPGMGFSASTDPPDGYRFVTGVISSSGVFGHDVGIASAYKVDCTESEVPQRAVSFGQFDRSALAGLTNVITDESVTFAVRGFNGSHAKTTLEDPRLSGGRGRAVTRADLASQDEHRVIRSHEAPALFASEADAEGYCEAVLDEFADDRPILALTFYASASAELRGQAIARRVGDKIAVTANGQTGLGISGQFFIENVNHQWSDGGKRWVCTWQLSPA